MPACVVVGVVGVLGVSSNLLSGFQNLQLKNKEVIE